MKLPEKWCIKVTKESINVLGKWRGSKMYGEAFGYCLSYYNTEKGFWVSDKPEDFELITFEQFKEHISMKKELIGYKLKAEYLEDTNVIKAACTIEGYITVGEHTIKDDIAIPIKSTESILKLKNVRVLDLWFDPVYKPENTLPTISGCEGSITKSGFVTYGYKTIHITHIRELLIIGITSLNIEGVIVTRKDLKQIVDYYDNM